MRDRETFVEEVASWAAAKPDVHAAVLVGSAARTATPADEWSDVDVALFVHDPAPYLADGGWLEALGSPLLTFVEPAATGGGQERRVLFDDGVEADFSVFPAAAVEHLLGDAGAVETVRRGHRVLFDRAGLASLLSKLPTPATAGSAAPALEQLANDVWYHALWAAKKLRRGEAWVARSCVDCYLGARLVETAALRARALDPGLDTWHGGRFVERWAGPEIVAALWEARVRDPGDVPAAIRRSVSLFDRLADETAALLDVPLELRRNEARARLDALLGG